MVQDQGAPMHAGALDKPRTHKAPKSHPHLGWGQGGRAPKRHPTPFPRPPGRGKRQARPVWQARADQVVHRLLCRRVQITTRRSAKRPEMRMQIIRPTLHLEMKSETLCPMYTSDGLWH